MPTDKKGVFAYTKYEPKGVVAIITPWNSPLTLTSWKLAPALAAGCTVVVKPSEFTSASMVEVASLLDAAGIPPGVVNVVTGFGPDVGEPLVRHPQVAHIGFTGGESGGAAHLRDRGAGTEDRHARARRQVAEYRVRRRRSRPGSERCVSGIFAASGQTCQAGSRLLLQRSIHDVFVEKLVAFVKSAKMGDPALPDTQIGPISTRPQFEKILSYIDVAKREGARCVLGGRSRPDLGAGLFIEPTILATCATTCVSRRRKSSGRCSASFRSTRKKTRSAIGNDVVYGLAAAVWTRSLRRAMRMTDALQAGTVWVNNYRATSFTSPFGGYKRSGIGRESGAEAIKEYLQTKCVWISSDLDVPNPFIRR